LIVESGELIVERVGGGSVFIVGPGEEFGHMEAAEWQLWPSHEHNHLSLSLSLFWAARPPPISNSSSTWALWRATQLWLARLSGVFYEIAPMEQ